MVKEPGKTKRDPSLAFDIFQKIELFQYRSNFKQAYNHEIQELLDRLKALDISDSGNEIHSILLLLKGFEKKCQQFVKLSATDQKKTVDFFKDMANGLQLLNEHVTESNIPIRNAFDAYTLVRTSNLIAFLQTLTYKQNLKENFKQEIMHPTRKASRSTFYDSSNDTPKAIEQELSIASDLKNVCEQLRSEVGSPETMPKGLVITFMVHLLDAITDCKQLMVPSTTNTDKLLAYIKREIITLKRFYPDLAEAGEVLQKATANYNPQKT